MGLALAMTLGAREEREDLHIMFNMYENPLDFELPKVPGKRWHNAVNTALASPYDIAEIGRETVCKYYHYKVKAHSIVVLVCK